MTTPTVTVPLTPAEARFIHDALFGWSRVLDAVDQPESATNPLLELADRFWTAAEAVEPRRTRQQPGGDQ